MRERVRRMGREPAVELEGFLHYHGREESLYLSVGQPAARDGCRTAEGGGDAEQGQDGDATPQRES